MACFRARVYSEDCKEEGKGVAPRNDWWLVSERGYIVRIVRRRVKEWLHAMTDGFVSR